MKKDAIYVLVIICLVAICLFLFKKKTVEKSEYDLYKQEAEKRIAAKNDSLIYEKLRYDSITNKIDSFTYHIDKQKQNIKYVYIKGEKERIRIISLDTNAAIHFLSTSLESELNKIDNK